MLRDHSPVCPVCNVGVLWVKGWMDQDATWYGGRAQPRRHIVLGGDPVSPPPKGEQQTPFFGRLCSGTVDHLSNCWALILQNGSILTDSSKTNGQMISNRKLSISNANALHYCKWITSQRSQKNKLMDSVETSVDTNNLTLIGVSASSWSSNICNGLHSLVDFWSM